MPKTKTITTSRALLLVTLAATLTAASPLYQNGGFEGPALAFGSVVLDCPGNVIGWTHTNNCNNGAELLTTSGSFGLSTLDGGQYITWGGNGFSGGTLEQTFDTLTGGIYTVDYLLAIQQGGTTQSMKAEVFDGATLLSSTGTTNFAFSTFTAGPTLTFTALSNSTTLRFTDLTSIANSVSANWGLDTVTLKLIGTTTPSAPEPGTVALLFTGLGAMLFSRCRAKNGNGRL